MAPDGPGLAEPGNATQAPALTCRTILTALSNVYFPLKTYLHLQDIKSDVKDISSDVKQMKSDVKTILKDVAEIKFMLSQR
jgi:hypothetical protein